MMCLKLSYPRHTRRTLLIVAIIFAVASGVNAYNWLTPLSNVRAATAPGDPLPAARQGGNPGESLETVLITIRPEGFEPAELARGGGQVLLVIENRSGIEELNLQLSTQAGERLREIHFSNSLLDWRNVENLAPGQYLITGAGHPDWRCLIAISN